MTHTAHRLAASRLAIGLALAPVLPLVLAPAATAVTTTRSSHVTTVKDDGRTNLRHPSLHVGDKYVIRFAECGSCGYQWRVVARANNAVVKGISTVKAPSSSSGTPIVGGSATRTYTFTAKGVGKTTVKLGYFGPSQSKATRTVTLAFTVTK